MRARAPVGGSEIVVAVVASIMLFRTRGHGKKSRKSDSEGFLRPKVEALLYYMNSMGYGSAAEVSELSGMSEKLGFRKIGH